MAANSDRLDKMIAAHSEDGRGDGVGVAFLAAILIVTSAVLVGYVIWRWLV